MPLYEYTCPAHGSLELLRTHAELVTTPTCPTCGAGLTRRYRVSRAIVRPRGYNLRPDEPGYSDFRRELELGELREPDEHSHLGAGAPSDEALEAEQRREQERTVFSEDTMQDLHELIRAHIVEVEG